MSAFKRVIALTPAPESAASGAAVTAAVGAVACGVCCVLPFAMPAVALAASGGVLAWLGQAFWGALYLAVGIVAAAWAWVLADTLRTRTRPARMTLSMMVLATAALALAAIWPTIEPWIIDRLRG